MKSVIGCGRRQSGVRAAAWVWTSAFALLLAAGSTVARAAEPALGEDSQPCQKCHDKADLKMQTQDGKAWSLHISTAAFLKSQHNSLDCTSCHDDIDGDKHASARPPVKSRRAYALTLNAACKSCHKKNVAQYNDSVHAVMLSQGSDRAPLCSDCHDVHTLQSVTIAKPVAETPCLKCHDAIGKAYAADVHGLERVARGKAAPICADCHQAHAIHAAATDQRLRDACLGCHKQALAQHKDWLPNAERHFEAISCPVCHAPTAERRVNLRLYDNLTKRHVSERTGVPRFEKRARDADQQGEGLTELALLSLLKDFSRDDGQGDVVLHGRLEVRSGVQAHQLAEKSKAIRDCDTCHREGAQAFQSVVLTIAGPDGRPLRHGVNKDVLSSMMATDSVRGFYAIGATRIKLLDVLLVLVVLGSLGGVLGHLTLKWATRRIRAKVAQENRAAPH
jgi:hypothetical protein